MTDLVLKLKGDCAFANFEQRHGFAKIVASLLSPDDRYFEPEQLNACGNTGLEWAVDRGNDWWVAFDENDKQRVRIRHRYNVREALAPLGGLIAYRYRCEVVTPEYQMPLPETA